MPRILILYYGRGKKREDGKYGNRRCQIYGQHRCGSRVSCPARRIINSTPFSLVRRRIMMMPFGIKQIFEEAAEKGISLKEKIGAALGSYGWSGEAPKLVLEILKNKLKMQIIETPVLARDEPKQMSLNACRDLGKRISEILNRRT